MRQSDLVSSLALLLSVGRSLVPKGSQVVGQSLEAGRSWCRGKEGQGSAIGHFYVKALIFN